MILGFLHFVLFGRTLRIILSEKFDSGSDNLLLLPVIR